MPVLYNADLSPYAARVRLAVYLKGLDDQVSFAPPPGDGLKSPEYLAENPLGKVPALKLDTGFCLPESELIVEYLEDAYPEPPLRPADPEVRAKARLVARLADLYLAPGLAPLFLNANPATRDPDKVEAGFETVATALRHIDHYLNGGLWAFGDDPSTADCALAPVFWFVNWADQVYGRSTLSDAPGCARLFAHVGETEVGERVYGELAHALKLRMSGQ